MQIRQFVTLFLLVTVCLSCNAYSETIGRTELDLPDSGWALVTTYTTDLKFFGGSSPTSTLPMQNNVYQLPGKDGTPKALLAIVSTHGGKGATIDWMTMRCPEPRSGYFTDNFGTGTSRRNYECLIVNNSFGPHNYYKPDSEVMKAVGEKSLKLFRSGYSFRSTYGARVGTYLHVNLMTQKEFKGMVGSAPSANQTHNVSPDLVAWGEALHKAVTESILSMSGKLVFPPIEFKE